MLGAEGDKPAGKSGQRKGKAAQTGKKTEPKKRKENQAKGPQPDQLLEALEREASAKVDQQVSEPEKIVAPAEVSAPAEIMAPAEIVAPAETVAPAEIMAPAEIAAPAETVAPAEIVAPIEISAPIETVAPVTSAESVATETPVVETPAIAAAEPAKTTPVSLQTLAEAYANYSKKSFEQTSCFVAKLAGAGSLAKALELQAAFAREAFETFVTESQRIRELHGQLARQRMTRMEGLVTGMTQGATKPTQKT